jgi:hypothetical protein
VTTLKHYAKVASHDLRRALDCLPGIQPVGSERQPLAATGTTGIANVVSLFAAPAQRAEDGPMRTDVADGGLTASLECGGASSADCPKPLTPPQFGGVVRAESAPDGRIVTERGGFEPPIRSYPYNGLANRRYRPLSHLSEDRTHPCMDVTRVAIGSVTGNLPEGPCQRQFSTRNGEKGRGGATGSDDETMEARYPTPLVQSQRGNERG